MPTTPAKPLSPVNRQFLEAVRGRVESHDVFGSARITDDAGGRLICPAKAAAEPAEYRLDFDAGKVWVSLVTPDRWLSESIEADLMHTGDTIEDLIEEELEDQGYSAGPLSCQHYRSDDKLFTFRSPLPIALDGGGVVVGGAQAAETASQCLLAYEACFRQLGDMEADDEED